MKDTTPQQNPSSAAAQTRRTNALKVSNKITLLSFGLVVATIVTLVLIVFVQKNRLAPVLGNFLDQQAYEEAGKLLANVYDSCAATEAETERQINHSIGLVREECEARGAASLSTEKVAWAVEDSDGHALPSVELPKLMLGTNWTGQNARADVPSPMVDEVHHFNGGSSTIWERMNDAGDMLRVVTSNLKPDGGRAIGTTMSVTNADGTPNPILAAVLKGNQGHGLTFLEGKARSSSYEPLWDAGHKNIIGMLSSGSDMTSVIQAVRDSIMKITLGKTGYMVVYNTKGNLRGHYVISKGGTMDGVNMWETKDSDGNMVVQDFIKKGEVATPENPALVKYMWTNPGEKQAHPKFGVWAYYAPWDWVIGATGWQEEYHAAQQTALGTLTALLWWIVGVAAVLTLVSLLISYRLARSITQPLNVLAHAADRVAKGDNTVRAEVTSDDEIGQLGDSFNLMLDARIKAKEDTDDYKRLQEGIQQLLTVTSDASDGDLTVRAKVTEGALGNVCDALNLMLENVAELLQGVQGAANRVASSATEIQASSEQLAQGSVKQSGEIINTTTAVQEMAANIESVSNNATAANEAATRAREAAEAGAKAVEQVVDGMERIRQNVQAGAKKIKRLGERSMEISTIVNTISQISGQTDMLALNAAIEAARAGEHGRGFTVVAEEVRKLAERTATATKEIEKLIAGIQAETNESVSAMEQQTTEVETESKVVANTGKELVRIRESSGQSADLINEINLAAKQQVRGAAGVVKAMETVSVIAQQAQTGAGQTKRATESLAALSSDLIGSLSKFKITANGNGK